MRSILTGLVAGVLLTGVSLAEGKFLTVTVPVDISAMPYIETFAVHCTLLDSPDGGLQNGPAHNRVDLPVVNGGFHGTVNMKLMAVWGPNNDPPPPWGYRCRLSRFPKDHTTGFTPIAPSAAGADTPPQHVAAVNTPLVTMVQAPFGLVQLMQTAPAVKPLPPKH